VRSGRKRKPKKMEEGLSKKKEEPSIFNKLSTKVVAFVTGPFIVPFVILLAVLVMIVLMVAKSL